MAGNSISSGSPARAPHVGPQYVWGARRKQATCPFGRYYRSPPCAGNCRLGTSNEKVAVCAAAAPVHKVAWANPLVSGKDYGPTTVTGAQPGDYVAFEWDDVVHDVWLVPSDAANPCDHMSKASHLIPPPWGSIRFRLALRTYAPWGVRVVSQTKSRKIPT